ncbi:M48 family metallopeptidase [Paenibacillus sp. CAU 1523]|uniref:M48 family metallopeptidase n=2 Tax=Paenibacillus arenosi TaxID=2774142 RepID=A0ABR9B6B6_9BACL|nr:SprT family zinc-dependent metalloprotease [Paenibacillus arenosi]MBD8500932.1 M48 family metallopeptidase [Paenibacillus arenosi]
MQVQIDNQIIHVDVQYGRRKKTTIHMDSFGRVSIKVPKEMTEETIRSAVEQYSKWISENLRKIEAAKAGPTKWREYDDAGTFLHLGKEYLLHELIDMDGLSEEELKLKLKKFYFASCKKIIGERIKIYQNDLKVKPKSFEIVESRTKWGTCSSDKKLTFNYRLAMAPIEVIDYVVIHELCHLHHMNHDRSFWRRVGSIMPDYKEKEQYLARHGQAMTF